MKTMAIPGCGSVGSIIARRAGVTIGFDEDRPIRVGT
jgi:hypothetical protein